MKLPPIELIELVHKFPGPYTFKIIAANDEAIIKNILEVIQIKLNLVVAPAYLIRLSDSGKHVSLTLELNLQKSQEVHVVYEALCKTTGVLLLL